MLVQNGEGGFLIVPCLDGERVVMEHQSCNVGHHGSFGDAAQEGRVYAFVGSSRSKTASADSVSPAADSSSVLLPLGVEGCGRVFDRSLSV